MLEFCTSGSVGVWVENHPGLPGLADQLGGKHLKRAAVVLDVLKHRPTAAEVYPLIIFAHDAHHVVDTRGTFGDERS